MSGPPSTPRTPRLLSATLEEPLFAHWPVSPATVRTRLPGALDVDTFDGDAYLGVVAFEVEVGASFAPVRRSFGQLNVRTYVEGPDGGSGVYFFSLDAANRLETSVARCPLGFPYYRAEVDVHRSDDRVRFRSRRTHRGAPPARFDAEYGPDGPAFAPESGTLDAFLVENYRYYVTDDDGRLYHGGVDHPPWRLRPARGEVRSNTLFEANGFDRPDGGPTLHVADSVDVSTVTLPRR